MRRTSEPAFDVGRPGGQQPIESVSLRGIEGGEQVDRLVDTADERRRTLVAALTGFDGARVLVELRDARGTAPREVAGLVYGAKVSEDTISRITDKVRGELGDWQDRTLGSVYPVLFVDAIHLEVRDGQPTFRPFSVVIGVTVDGQRDISGSGPAPVVGPARARGTCCRC